MCNRAAVWGSAAAWGLKAKRDAVFVSPAAGLANNKSIDVSVDAADAVKVSYGSNKNASKPRKVAASGFVVKSNARRALAAIGKQAGSYRADLKVRCVCGSETCMEEQKIFGGCCRLGMHGAAAGGRGIECCFGWVHGYQACLLPARAPQDAAVARMSAIQKSLRVKKAATK
jgi:hypothetical protein